MYKKRDYQEECHKDTLEKLNVKNPKPVVSVIPTGGGKSFSIALLTQEMNEKTLILCPTQEILEQNYQKFISFGGEAGIYSASLGSKAVSKVTYATIGSVKSLGGMFKGFGVSLLVIDEAHLGTDPTKGMFKTFLGDLNPQYIVGYTATPFRLKNYSEPFGMSYNQINMLTRTRPKLFSEMAHVTQISHLTENNFWAPVEVYEEDFNPLGLVIAGSDYSESSMVQVNKNNNTNNRIYKLIKRLLADGEPSILVFLDSVANCHIMANAIGVKDAVVIEGNTSKSARRKYIEKFKEGKIKVLVCDSTLTTGFDDPRLGTVIMGRPTQSLSIYYQIYGRVVRPFPGKVGKFYDFGANVKRFGRPEDLVIENYDDYGWGVFSGDRLLTGVPLNGEPINKSHLIDMKKSTKLPEFRNSTKRFFEFGVHKGVPLSKVPKEYMQWAITNAKSNMSENLFNECKKILATN